MSVSNGQIANETTFNNAFPSRTDDTSLSGQVDLLNADAVSGDTVENIQRELNSEASYTGKSLESAKDDLPVWTETNAGSGTDNLTERAEALTAEFNISTGHTHDGVDSAVVAASSLSSVRLRGYMVRGTNLTAVTGSSVVVTTQMSGKTESSGDTGKGVVTGAGNNKVIIREKTSLDDIVSAVGDLVYGRITKASTVWTLSFYTDIAGTETAYSLVAQDVAWYYEELFNPITDAPIYNDLKTVPSDNATQDVVDASATQRGLMNTSAQAFAGAKTFNDSTQSTTKDTGGVILEGGLGVEKNVNAGGNIVATGTVTGSNLSGTNTGDQTITLSTDLSGSGTSTVAATIVNDAVTNAKLANVATQTFKGRTTASTGDPEDLTVTQATALLNAFVGDSGSGGTKGLVPAPASGDAAAAKFLKADGTFAVPAGTGGGGGSGINYITNSGAETDTSGWATYADAAGNIPVDGTGGTATSLTFSRSTSSPLRTTGSFSIVQTNSTSIQGKGVSYDFTIDAADKAKPLSVTFDFNASSTFVASNGVTAPLNDGTTTTNAGNSDLEVFIYDVTNAVLIPVTPQVIAANGANNFSFKGIFQAASNSTSYRLIFHVATTSANATGWTFKYDNVSVGPQAVLQGPPITDWAAYTPTFSAGFGTASAVSFFSRRVGDMLHVHGTFTTGTVAASVGSISLPTGLALDTAKLSIANTTANPGPLVGQFAQPGFADQAGTIVTATSTSTTVVYYGNEYHQSAMLTPVSISGVLGSSQVSSVNFQVPISGWSSTTVMSNDTDTRVVECIVTGQPANMTSTNPIIFPTVANDTHAGYSTSTGKYTIPVAGFYKVSAVVLATVTGTSVLRLYKTGSLYAVIGFAPVTNGVMWGSGDVFCVAGDTLHISSDSNMTSFTATVPYNQMSITRISGPSAIAAAESVNARYYASATSISGSLATISWTTKDFDSHGAMSAGVYTVPVAGKYQVNAALLLSGTFILNNTSVMEIQKTGTVVSRSTEYAGGAITQFKNYLSDEISCVAGDTIRIQVSSSGTGPAVVSSNFENYISIFRTGN